MREPISRFSFEMEMSPELQLKLLSSVSEHGIDSSELEEIQVMPAQEQIEVLLEHEEHA